MTIYDNGYDKLLVRGEGDTTVPQNEVNQNIDLGVLANPLADLGSYTGGITNLTTDVTSSQSLTSGATPAIIWFGKTTFDDTTSGYRFGVDEDGEYKHSVGDASGGWDWNVTTADTLTITGTIYATSGVIGGWTISSTTLSSGTTNIVLDSSNKGIYINDSTFGNAGIQLEYNSGTPRAYIGDGSTYFFNFDGTNISWGASATTLSTAGLLTTTSALIGGWSVVTGYIYSLQSGTPSSSPTDGVVMASGNEGLIVYEDAAKRAEIGYLSSGVYGVKVYDTGGSNVIFEASDTQQKMAGWYFTTTTLATDATANNANVLIDSGNSLIRLGPTSGTTISVDGANQKIESSDYVSGYAGAGFTLSANLLEVGNIACRGIIRTAVFQKDIISAVGGNVAILDADVLDTDMTALDASTLTIEGNTTFAVNDILRIKDGTDDEWLLVTNIASAPTYTVTRDQAGVYAADSNPAWKKGASVVNYGASGEGGVYMTASETNAPYLSVFSHAGSPWTTITTHLRMGNLNGYLGYAADTYGLGIGSSSASQANLTFDTTNGIRLRTATTDKIVLDNSGNAFFAGTITVGDGTNTSGILSLNHAATKGDTYISGGTVDASTWTATSGFIMGVDDSDSDKVKFYLGTSGSALDWNVTSANTLTVTGAITATSGSITGAFTIGTSGSLSSGQSAYNTGTGYWFEYNGGTPRFSVGDGTTANSLLWTGTDLLVKGSPLANNDVYGDGSDGDVTISSNTNLTRDMFYNNLTISASYTLNPSGYRIFVKNTLTIAATAYIARNGNNGGNATNGSGFNPGTAGAAGAALAAGSIIGGIQGVAGGNGGAGGTSVGPLGGTNGSAGTTGNDAAKSIGSDGKAGVSGGGGGSYGGAGGGSGGGAGAKGSQTGTVYNTVKSAMSAFYLSDSQSSTWTNFTNTAGTGGSGGGGGGGSGATGGDYGGGGGGGGGSGTTGGVIWIAAKTLVNEGAITATGGAGGNGGNGANGNAHGGGGGGGGAGSGGGGGVVVVIYSNTSGSGTITASGGSAGSIGTKGTGAGGGNNGTDGTAGSAGNDGVVLELEV